VVYLHKVCKKREDQVSNRVTNLHQVKIKSLRCTQFFEGVLLKKVKQICVESNKKKKRCSRFSTANARADNVNSVDVNRYSDG
jgi:hypothetical protein